MGDSRLSQKRAVNPFQRGDFLGHGHEGDCPPLQPRLADDSCCLFPRTPFELSLTADASRASLGWRSV